MNDTLFRWPWDKGCTDIMYMTIEYPKHPIISLLTKPRGNCVYVLRDSTSGLELEFSLLQLNALPLSYNAPVDSLFKQSKSYGSPGSSISNTISWYTIHIICIYYYLYYLRIITRSVYLSVCLSIFLSTICLSVYFYVYVCIGLSIYIFLLIYLFKSYFNILYLIFFLSLLGSKFKLRSKVTFNILHSDHWKP